MVTSTSLRFRQLATWQAGVMPKNLFGGIKGRKLWHLQTRFKLSLDNARSNDIQFVGIKLDKSKCFDRLIPSISAAIMLAMGEPFQVGNVWAKLYSGLQRYLSHQNWTNPTTSVNGVIQGCSLSLLAINCHMACWTLFLQKFQSLSVAAYIDDAYLWCEQSCIDELQEAVDITHQWDSLTGQAANEGMSVAWASSTKGRQMMKSTFRNMKHSHSVEVLGSNIQTTEELAFGWDPKKDQKKFFVTFIVT